MSDQWIVWYALIIGFVTGCFCGSGALIAYRLRQELRVLDKSVKSIDEEVSAWLEAYRDGGLK